MKLSRLPGWMPALAIIFVVIVLQTLLLGGREYRLDEVWRLHAAVDRSLTETMAYIYQDVNPPLYPVLASLWLPLTGHTEQATHHISALILLLTMAFYARFVTDTFDGRTATWAVGLLGVLPVFFFYTHDAGPYTLYMLAWTTTTFSFGRWLRRGQVRYALVYVGFGIIGVYTQFFTVFVIATHIAFLLLAVPFSWRRTLFGLWMAAAIALALLGGWGLVLAEQALSGQSNELLFAYFTTWSLDSVRVVVTGMDVLPVLAVAVAGVFVRLGPRTTSSLRFGYPRLPLILGLLGLGLFGLLFAINTEITRILTPRNLLIFLPLIGLLAAIAIRHLGNSLGWAVGGLALLSLLWYPLWTFGDYFAARDVAHVLDQYIEDRATVIVTQSTLTEFAFIPINYYLRERISPQPESVILLAPPPVDNNAVRNVPFPHPPDERFFAEDTPTDREQLLSAIAPHDQVWEIVFQQNPLGEILPEILRENHYLASETQVAAGNTLVPSGEVIVNEYRRLPDDLTTRFRFGDSISLQGWQIDPLTVAPCGAVSMRSFWQGDAPLDANYSMNLSAVSEDGTVLSSNDSALTRTLTGLWQMDTTYVDTRTLEIPCEAVPGAFALVVTVYDPVDVSRLPVRAADGTNIESVVFLTTLTVE